MPWQWEISSTFIYCRLRSLPKKKVEEAYYSMWSLIYEGMLIDIQSHLWTPLHSRTKFSVHFVMLPTTRRGWT